MEEVLTNITNYITLYAPIAISILGSIITIVQSVKRVKNIETESSTELKRMKSEMVKTQEACTKVMQENAELKAQLNQTLLDNHKIYERKHGRK